MPIYEYECSECGRFEVIQKFSDKPLKQCPQCKEKGKSNPVTKALSAPAFHLKGSGWYKTDYSSGASTASGSKKSKDSSKESSGSSSSDTSSSTGSSSNTDSSSSSDSSSKTTTPKKACGSGCGCH